MRRSDCFPKESCQRAARRKAADGAARHSALPVPAGSSRQLAPEVWAVRTTRRLVLLIVLGRYETFGPIRGLTPPGSPGHLPHRAVKTKLRWGSRPRLPSQQRVRHIALPPRFVVVL